jgi:hypothetical protein
MRKQLKKLTPYNVLRTFAIAIGTLLLVLVNYANAAETVQLQYQDQRLEVSFSDFQSFAEGRSPSAEIQTFLTDAEQDPASIQTLVTQRIRYGQNGLIPNEFALIRASRALGDPRRRESKLTDLQIAYEAARSREGDFSVLEVLENYPGSTVRLSIDQLQPTMRELDLLLNRITQVLAIVARAAPELLCDLDSEAIAAMPIESAKTTASARASPITPKATMAQLSGGYTASLAMASLITDKAITSPATPSQTGSLSASPKANSMRDQSLVVRFGPLETSISLAELTQFAEGENLPGAWGSYLRIAGIKPEDFRLALTQELKVDALFLDGFLNSLLGEYALYQAGQLVSTRTGRSNIQALRSAVMLSALDDDRLTALEFLSHYPISRIYLDGVKLSRLGSSLGNLGAIAQRERVDASDPITLEDWFVALQVAAAEQGGTCKGKRSPKDFTILNKLQISSDRRAEFLPPNWQPVPAHREDRGNIQVVWLQGTPYEMGYQHGQYLRDEIASIGSEAISLLRFAGRGLGLGRLARARTYPDIIEECRGLADATQDIGITLDACLVLAFGDVYQDFFGQTLPQELFWEGCSQFVAANEASRDGYLYHGSTVDHGTPTDYIINNPIVFVRQPNDGLPHVFITYPGVTWPNSGLNVAGISMGLDTAFSKGYDSLSFTGTSNVQLMSQILQGATSFDEAVNYFESQPRVRPNIIMMTDGKSRQAGVLEFTGQDFFVRPLQPNGVLYATNHFVSEEMYDEQAPPNASSLSRLKRYTQLMEPDGIASFYGQVDAQVMTKILRDRVNPDTLESSPLSVFDDDASPGGNGAQRQATFDPQRLNFWIAAGPPPVPENPFVCFSLEELLDFPDATPCDAPQIP